MLMLKRRSIPCLMMNHLRKGVRQLVECKASQSGKQQIQAPGGLHGIRYLVAITAILGLLHVPIVCRTATPTHGLFLEAWIGVLLRRALLFQSQNLTPTQPHFSASGMGVLGRLKSGTNNRSTTSTGSPERKFSDRTAVWWLRHGANINMLMHLLRVCIMLAAVLVKVLPIVMPDRYVLDTSVLFEISCSLTHGTLTDDNFQYIVFSFSELALISVDIQTMISSYNQANFKAESYLLGFLLEL